MADEKVKAVLQPMRDLHQSGTNRTLKWRRTQLLAMKEMITTHRNEFLEAVQQDLNKHLVEGQVAELTPVETEINHMLSHLASYMAPTKVASPGLLAPAFSEIRYEPLRSPAVLIIAPFNYPVHLALLPAVGSLAAGNPTVIKPSELTATVSALLAKLIPRYFDKSSLAVVEGDIPETTALLKQPWGLVFFTGSTRVGKIIASKAAETLTPVILELGGKSPTYIDKNCPEMTTTADRIAWGKLANAGQTCVAPDYVLCHEDVLDQFKSKIVESVRKMYGDNPKKNSDLPRIVSRSHAERLISVIKEQENDKTAKILLGSSKECDASSRFVTPTIVLNPSRTSTLMSEEIFGPILPIISVSSDTEATDFIAKQQSGMTPLALYVFTTSGTVFERVYASCPSAAIVRNDVIVHNTSHDMPFGGLGTSGYGSYHGKFSFEAFSHKRATMYKPAHWLFEYGGVRYAPYEGLKGQLFVLLTKLPRIPVLHARTVMNVCVLGLALFYIPALKTVRVGMLQGMTDGLDYVSSLLRK